MVGLADWASSVSVTAQHQCKAVLSRCVIIADTSQDLSTVTSLDDDVKHAVSRPTQVPVCARERQSVITDAREALASSTLRESANYFRIINILSFSIAPTYYGCCCV